MAYVSQETKAKIAPAVKALLKEYRVKGSLSVRNHMTLCLTIKSGSIDFIGNYNNTVSESRFMNERPITYIDVNPYHFRDHFSGRAKEFLTKVFHAMNVGNHDNSDIQTDYFDVGWYVDVNIGKWDKPYTIERL